MRMAAVSVERLYELCDILDSAKEKLSEHDSEYIEIMQGSKSGAAEKKLASSFIVRYFHEFPDLRDRALDAMFELCEDDDVTIRKFVIKELPSLCRDTGPHVSKVADVLTQLLQSDDSQEQLIVYHALTALLKKYPKETLTTIFGHILNCEEELIRERAVKFLALKLRILPSSIMTSELENFIFEESKKVLQDVTGEEFILFIHILSSLSQLQTVSGRQKLLELITEQADLEKPFDAKDSDRVDQICQCFKQAIPYLSKNVPSTTFIDFMLRNVLPVIDETTTESNENIKLEIYRILADLSPHCSEIKEKSDEKLECILKKLIDCLPLPPSESDASSAPGENLESEKNVEDQIRFSEAECLLWSMHQIGKKHPSFFTNSSTTELMKELRKRLTYVARVIQVYSKKLRELLTGKTKEELTKEENKVKVLALRTTSNITTIARDMLHQPPIFKSSISPSWKSSSSENKSAASSGTGTRQDDDDEPAKKTSRKEVSMYRPPGGKFSEKAGAFQDPGNGFGFGNRNGNMGGWRGRGRVRGSSFGRGYRY